MIKKEYSTSVVTFKTDKIKSFLFLYNFHIQIQIELN
jgi:hypothetical protein